MAGPRTGCGCMTSRTGSMIIGWLEVAFLAPFVLVGVVALGIGLVGLPVCEYTSANENEQERLDGYCRSNRIYFCLGGMGTLALCSLFLAGPVSLLHGINIGKPSFLIPYIIFGVVKNILLFISTIVFAIIGPRVVLVLPFVSLVIEVYKTTVVYCHYDYLAQKPKDYPTELLAKQTERPSY